MRTDGRSPSTFQLNWFLRGPDGNLTWPVLLEGWRAVQWLTEGEAQARKPCPARDGHRRAGRAHW